MVGRQNKGVYLTATDARRHVWHACLSSGAIAVYVRSPMSVESAYARLTYAKGKNLILQAYACGPAGVMRILGRLGTQARPPEVYRALATALVRSSFATPLTYQTNLSLAYLTIQSD
jgi:hypothetical protein